MAQVKSEEMFEQLSQEVRNPGWRWGFKGGGQIHSKGGGPLLRCDGEAFPGPLTQNLSLTTCLDAYDFSISVWHF